MPLHLSGAVFAWLLWGDDGDPWLTALGLLNFTSGTWTLAALFAPTYGGSLQPTVVGVLAGLTASYLWTVLMLRGLFNTQHDGRFSLRGLSVGTFLRALGALGVLIGFSVLVKAVAISLDGLGWIMLAVAVAELLFIPGLWLVPAVLAIERRPMFDAIGRSLEVSRGSRITLFVLVCLVAAIQFLFVSWGADAYGSGTAYGVVVVAAVLTTSFHACLMAAAYQRLAYGPAPPRTDELEQVFR